MKTLAPFLENLTKRYHRTEYLKSDPLEYVHHYPHPHDQEVVALLGALLAYGSVGQARKSIDDLLHRMKVVDDSPKRFVRHLQDTGFVTKAEDLFSSFVHRFNSGHDMIILLRLLSDSWERFGSLGGHFLSFLEPSDENISRALDLFIADLKGQALAQFGVLPEDSFNYLLTAPKDGSACKRWCMLLRWMGRKDRLDLGLWMKGSPLSKSFPPGRGLSSRQLVFPMDTHTSRLTRYMGLTQRKTTGWKAALDVTRSLSQIDPVDPTRFDFSIARLGILDLCKKEYRAEICEKCELRPACLFAAASELK